MSLSKKCQWTTRSITIHHTNHGQHPTQMFAELLARNGAWHPREIKRVRAAHATMLTYEGIRVKAVKDCFAATKRRKSWGWHDMVRKQASAELATTIAENISEAGASDG